MIKFYVLVGFQATDITNSNNDAMDNVYYLEI